MFKHHSQVPCPFVKMKMFWIVEKDYEKQKLNLCRSALFRMRRRFSGKYFVNDSLWKYFFASNSPKTPLNLNSLPILANLRLYTQD